MTSAPPPHAPAVTIEHLSKRFGATLALDDLTLEVRRGEVFGFLGPNGAGKSTTIRCLLGLIRPSTGRVRVFDDDAADVRRAHRHLAYVPADVALWPSLTGAEILHLIAATGPGADPGYRAELVERFALDPGKPATTYSTGNRQKVALIAAFASRAPLLVLDEPTSGLDPLMENQFRVCVAQARERGQTVFLSSHQLGEVEALCDRVAILRAGRLVQIATLAELRGLHRTVIEITYPDLPPDLDGVTGVASVEPLDGRRLRFTLTGTAAPALAALAAAGVTGLSAREPSLEEIFLDYYGQAAR
ncbi:ABC transporter ATP-binding protein [Nocardia harenae]|uniref:ABC transporter ATP-binding protein n=1 Tax=Nocardia harenae TaxID=358707 RepID=UPI00082B6457|nr:ABC transporter ATP-binding protein [Nocardia harenae]